MLLIERWIENRLEHHPCALEVYGRVYECRVCLLVLIYK